MKKSVCPRCERALEIEYDRTREPQPAGFAECPNCGEAVAGNERPCFIRITVSLADQSVVQEDGDIFFPKRGR
jgi:uncharacterized Zn finger protein